jgi:hypothetical protein
MQRPGRSVTLMETSAQMWKKLEKAGRNSGVVFICCY